MLDSSHEKLLLGSCFVLVGFFLILFHKQIRERSENWNARVPWSLQSIPAGGPILTAMIIIFGALLIYAGVARVLSSLVELNKIDSSYIATRDLIIFGGAMLLYFLLANLPPNGPIARALAVICGLAIVSIMIVIPVADLTSREIHSLAYAGFCLAMSLWKWNDERVKSKCATAGPVELNNDDKPIPG